jgi:hypothetical protein
MVGCVWEGSAEKVREKWARAEVDGLRADGTTVCEQ